MITDTIEIKASELRSEWGLSPYDPVPIKQLLLKLNILTLFRSLEENLSGMCLKRNEKRFLLINSNHPIGRQNFSIAHELYHLFVQETFDVHYCNPGNHSSIKQEKEADFFASVFLMPEIGIKKMIPEQELIKRDVSVATLLKLEQYYGVSGMALLVRLKTLGLITKEKFSEYQGLPKIRTAREFGYDPALYLPGNDGLVLGDYGVKAKALLDKDLISEGHYIELLSKIGVDPTLNNE